MPRLPTLRIRALADLERQLRFESADAARRQLARAEALALELLDEDPERAPTAYPEEWIIFRITGLRPETALESTADGAQAAMLVREALLGDLAALIERLSSPPPRGRGQGGGFEKRTASPNTPRETWLTVPDLCARWKITRKTLERLRRRGLFGRRISLGKGRAHVVFSERVVRVFEKRHAMKPRTAPKLTRLSTTEQQAIIAAALTERAKNGSGSITLDRAARAIARLHTPARAIETIRRVLKRHDERADEPIFAHRARLSTHERSLVGHAASRAANLSKTAARLGRTRGAVYRILHNQRAARLRALDLSGPIAPLDAFDAPTPVAEKRFLSPPLVRTGLGALYPIDPAAMIHAAAVQHPVPAPDERAIASACAFLKHRAARHITALSTSTARATSNTAGRGLDEIERDLLWAARLKTLLVFWQLPLILRAIEAQTERPLDARTPHTQHTLLRLALDSVIEHADRFDPFKGGRLAATISVPLGRALAAWHKQNPPLADGVSSVDLAAGALPRLATRRAPTLAPPEPDDWPARVCPWQSFLDLDTHARSRIAALPERERRALALHLGLPADHHAESEPPRTPAEIAPLLRTTPTRAAAILRRAKAHLVMPD